MTPIIRSFARLPPVLKEIPRMRVRGYDDDDDDDEKSEGIKNR